MIEWIVTSSILIAVIIALRFILKGKISLRLQYALWALVLLRLLVTMSFGSTELSVMNAVPKNVPSALFSAGVPRNAYTSQENSAITPAAEQKWMARPAFESTGAVTNEIARLTDWGSIAKTVWLSGIAVVGLWLLISNLRLAARLKKTRRPLSVEGCRLPLYLSDAVDTPCLFGLFRPAIYATGEAAEEETKLRHVIEHEMTHFRHGDHVWSLLRGVCLALHWYNPLVWWAAILSRNDAELACDEATINRIGEDERAEYGRTLIGMTCQRRPALLLTATTMTGSGRSIKERIKLIAKKPKTAIYTLVAVLLITAIAVGCTFTGAKDDNPWTWASGINPNTLYSATVWSGGYDTSLSDDECQELSHIIRGLSRGSFTENTQLVGSTPTYGIVIGTSSGVYNINESIASDSALEMKYADKQWWIDSDELTEFICQHILNVGTDIGISVEVDTDIPTAVIDYAMDYTETQLSYYTGELGYEITEAKIVGLTQINTGTAALDHSINMYLLEYRFLPANPDEVMLVGGMKMEDGYITQWGSTGQPYLLLLHDENDDWTRICTTNTDIIEQEYGTPEMLAQYGNAYTAASMELYARYLSTYTLNDVTIVLEPGFTIREKGYRCFINDDGVMVGVELLDKDSDRLVDFAPGYDEKFDPFSLPTDGYGNHYRDFVFEGEYHYIVYREFEQGVVIVELMCPEYEGYSESLKESYKSKFPVWAASAGPAGQSTADAAAPSKPEHGGRE